MRTIKRFIIPGSAIVCLLATATVAQAVIGVQRGISGVTMGMSPARVKEALGTPSKVKTGSGAFGPFTRYLYPGKMIVQFQGSGSQATVSSVQISGQTDKTATGVGVGSTETALKHGVHGVKCTTTPAPERARLCTVGKLTIGKTVTTFYLTSKGGRVTEVLIGIVLD